MSISDQAEGLAKQLETLLRDLPEAISLDDMKHHKGLIALLVHCDDMVNRVEYRAYEHAKTVYE